MESLRKLWLLGPDGKPLDERLRTVFNRLLPKFRRRFPAIQDEAEIQNHGEEAARRFQHKEQQSGQELEKPWGYAWSALESVGISAERTNEMQVRFRTVESRSDSAIVSQLRAWDGSVEQTERAILLRQLEARLLIIRKRALLHTDQQLLCGAGAACDSNGVLQMRPR
jgi:hypothetical protein